MEASHICKSQELKDSVLANRNGLPFTFSLFWVGTFCRMVTYTYIADSVLLRSILNFSGVLKSTIPNLSATFQHKGGQIHTMKKSIFSNLKTN